VTEGKLSQVKQKEEKVDIHNNSIKNLILKTILVVNHLHETRIIRHNKKFQKMNIPSQLLSSIDAFNVKK